jgi:hypothetical protein
LGEVFKEKQSIYESAGGDNTSNFGVSFYVNLFVLSMIIFFRKFNKKLLAANNLQLLLALIFILQFALFLLLFVNPLILFRSFLLLIVFQGFFFILVERFKFYRSLLYSLSLFNFVYFLYLLKIMQDSPTGRATLVFFKGEVFTTNIVDYILFSINSQIN